MIAFVRPPEKPTRSPVMERARRLLATTLLRPGSDQASKIAPVAAWKAWLLGGLLIALALWCGYIVVAMF